MLRIVLIYVPDRILAEGAVHRADDDDEIAALPAEAQVAEDESAEQGAGMFGLEECSR